MADLSRRVALQIGAISTFGLAAHCLATGRAANGREKSDSKAKRCLLIWLDGGPSHLETFDPKPDAPLECRGPLRTIATAIPGVALGQGLVEIAKRLKDCCIIRSMTSPLGEHNLGTHYMLTGFPPSPSIRRPTFGPIAESVKGNQWKNAASPFPAHIAIPDFSVGGANLSPIGFMEAKYSPWELGGNITAADYAPTHLTPYRSLELKRVQRRKDFSAMWSDSAIEQAADKTLQTAFDLVLSAQAKGAFRLDEESPATQNRYGTKLIGRACLLARRLVERNVPLISINYPGWDTHEAIVDRLHLGYTGAVEPVGLVPSLDRALSALIDDLKSSGLLDETLIVVMGEFGRTPKLNTTGGRDHWPRVFSTLLAGGGCAAGSIVGSSDATGENPRDLPVTPSDLLATIYHMLGIPLSTILTTPEGRQVGILPDGSQPISAAIA